MISFSGYLRRRNSVPFMNNSLRALSIVLCQLFVFFFRFKFCCNKFDTQVSWRMHWICWFIIESSRASGCNNYWGSIISICMWIVFSSAYSNYWFFGIVCFADRKTVGKPFWNYATNMRNVFHLSNEYTPRNEKYIT